MLSESDSPDSLSLGSAFNGREPCPLSISTDAKAGYGRIGLNFNLPLPSVGANMDLAFRDANVWIGSVGVRADSGSGFFLALRGQGNASRMIDIQTPEEPFGATDWDGSKLQWWELEGSIGYKVRPWWSALVGLRRDQLSVGLTNPRANGVPLNFTVNVPPVFFSEQFHGDFSSKLWIPYLGLEITGQRYRASLLYSPFASADIRVPDVIFASFFVTVPPGILEQAGEDLEYKVQKRIQFFEYNFEYSVDVHPDLAFQVWSAGSWGTGNFDALLNVLISVGGFPLVNETDSSGSNGTATYTRSMISGGIGAVLSF